MFCPVSLDDTSEIQPVLLALLKLSSTLASHRGWESDVAAERMGMKHARDKRDFKSFFPAICFEEIDE